MILIAVLIALSLWGIVATVRAVRLDGYRQEPTDWTRTDASASTR